MRELSIVIPVMNEQDSVEPLVSQIRAAMNSLDYEIIFVDDGSSDHTRANILHLMDDRLSLIELKRNYGQSAAMAAGIEHSHGEFIALLDGDLQNDPSDIPPMLTKLKDEDWDVVAGNRKNRKDGMLLRKFPSRIANALIRCMTKVYIQDYGCTLKVFRRDIALGLKLHGELHRFIPVLAALQGASITQVDVKHHSRQYGKSKYGLGRTFKVMSDIVMLVFFRRYSQKPMHLFGTVGFVLLLAGIVINLYLFALKLMGHNIWGKPLMILGVICLLGGIQMLAAGIIAEIGMRILTVTSASKSYQIRKIHETTHPS